jgi:uncharacterized membrane protein
LIEDTGVQAMKLFELGFGVMVGGFLNKKEREVG